VLAVAHKLLTAWVEEEAADSGLPIPQEPSQGK
jgi:hypothetical protein